jgi:hypothetical protein
MNYTTNDGKLVQGSTAEEVAQDLRSTSLQPERSLQAYIDRVAQRAFELRGITVRTDTLGHFIEDIRQADLLRPVAKN